MVTSKAIDSSRKSVELTNYYLSFLFQQVKELTQLLSTNEELQGITKDYSITQASPYDYVKKINDFALELMYQAELNSKIDSIYLYIPDKTLMITSDPDIFTHGYFPSNNWTQFVENLDTAYSWVGHFYDNKLKEKNYISLMSRLDIINRELPINVYLSINFSERSIYDIIARIRIYSGTRLYLLDPQRKIVASENPEDLGNSIPEDPVDREVLEEENFLKDYLVIQSENIENQFTLIALVPLRELLREQRVFLSIFAGAIICISVIFIILISRIIIAGVNKPIGMLVSFMEEVERGNFNTAAPPIYTQRGGGSDEFNFLFESFNRMVRRTKVLIQDLFLEKNLHSEMELKFLQTQINPHFLYNTLDSINWIAKRNGITEISNIVQDLSNLYRSVFNKGKECISVEEALMGISSYLNIQSHRYAGRFTFRINVPAEIQKKPILNLILQPVVENAVLHGIGEGIGQISINAAAEKNEILFTIEDTGSGMDLEKLELLRRSLSCTSSTPDSGLVNVQKRITLFYGTEYGIGIDSELGKGTCVSIKIPAEWRQKPEIKQTVFLDSTQHDGIDSGKPPLAF
jgi:sensor histidine kinase YesM